jgi:small subunit ribosomal protein S11
MAKKKKIKEVSEGIVHIKSTFNNAIVTVSDMNGNVICWASGGSCGFKGTKKGTPYAAQVAAEKAIKEAMNHGIKEVDIRVKGPGPGRETAIRAIAASGVKVRSIRDVTPIPHNGCRPKKKRRV